MYGIFVVQDGNVILFSTTGELSDARKEMEDAIESGHEIAFILKLEVLAE